MRIPALLLLGRLGLAHSRLEAGVSGCVRLLGCTCGWRVCERGRRVCDLRDWLAGAVASLERASTTRWAGAVWCGRLPVWLDVRGLLGGNDKSLK